MRRYVIGDVHGCSKALRTVIEAINPTSNDTLIFLGDFIDRGPDSRGVIELLLSVSQQTQVIGLRGNHEVMLLGVACAGCDPTLWLQGGGSATMTSYGGTLSRIPTKHLEFLRALKPHHETGSELFIHAGYHPELPLQQVDDATRYWNHLTEIPAPHQSGKRAFVGHTPQASGAVLDVGHLVCVDTYCFGGGYLTALDLDSDEVIQANRHGHLRRDLATTLSKMWRRWFGQKPRRSQVVNRDGAPTRAAEDATGQPWQGGVMPDTGSLP